VLHSGEVLGHAQIVLGLLHRAAVARAVVAAPRAVVPETARYDLRILLLHLGFIGAEFKAQRERLLRRRAGSTARRVEQQPRSR